MNLITNREWTFWDDLTLEVKLETLNEFKVGKLVESNRNEWTFNMVGGFKIWTSSSTMDEFTQMPQVPSQICKGRGAYHTQAWLSSIQHQNLTLYMFVADSMESMDLVSFVIF